MWLYFRVVFEELLIKLRMRWCSLSALMRVSDCSSSIWFSSDLMMPTGHDTGGENEENEADELDDDDDDDGDASENEDDDGDSSCSLVVWRGNWLLLILLLLVTTYTFTLCVSFICATSSFMSRTLLPHMSHLIVDNGTAVELWEISVVVIVVIGDGSDGGDVSWNALKCSCCRWFFEELRIDTPLQLQLCCDLKQLN